MTNLLSETIKAIKNSGHTPDDIIFIGSERSGHQCTWEEYLCLADCFYDSDFGAQEVARGLIIVFSDGQKMWRSEYGGSEWWSYSKPFVPPSESRPIIALVHGSWSNLAEIEESLIKEQLQ